MTVNEFIDKSFEPYQLHIQELEKEVEDVVYGMGYDTYESDGHSDFAVHDILVKFAEPREKRIAELELKIKHITKHLEPQVMTALFEQVEEEVKQEQRIKELEAKIEKIRDYLAYKIPHELMNEATNKIWNMI